MNSPLKGLHKKRNPIRKNIVQRIRPIRSDYKPTYLSQVFSSNQGLTTPTIKKKTKINHVRSISKNRSASRRKNVQERKSPSKSREKSLSKNMLNAKRSSSFGLKNTFADSVCSSNKSDYQEMSPMRREKRVLMGSFNNTNFKARNHYSLKKNGRIRKRVNSEKFQSDVFSGERPKRDFFASQRRTSLNCFQEKRKKSLKDRKPDISICLDYLPNEENGLEISEILCKESTGVSDISNDISLLIELDLVNIPKKPKIQKNGNIKKMNFRGFGRRNKNSFSTKGTRNDKKYHNSIIGTKPNNMHGRNRFQ